MHPARSTLYDALDLAFRRLETRWARPDEYPDTDGWYGYEPLPVRLMAEGFELLGPADGRRFLDLGCGIGRMMLVAQRLGFNVSGVEWHLPYISAAWLLVPEAENIHQGDARSWPLDGFDVVYCYQLATTEEGLLELATSIVERTKPGTVLWLPGFDEVPGAKSIGPYVWER